MKDGAIDVDARVLATSKRPLLLKNATDQKRSSVTAGSARDLLAGGIGGIAGVLVGHPFDTIKVRQQTESAVRNVGTTTKADARRGAVSLFRGMGPPLATAGIVNAMVFCSYGGSGRLWDRCFVDPLAGFGTDRGDRRVLKSFVSGTATGIFTALVICPAEHIKCRLQIQPGIGVARYCGPTDALKKIYASHGFRGLYRGWVATCSRQGPGLGIYFATYESIKERLRKRLERHNSGHAQLKASILAGGIAGSLSWASIYPIDVIKTRIQTSPLECSTPRMRTMWKILIREGGVKALFRGIGITVFRAFAVNGIIFPVYEFVSMQLEDARFGDHTLVIDHIYREKVDIK